MHISDRGAALRRSAFVICVSMVAACTSKSSPTEPSSPTNSNSAVSGSVVEALTGVPISGATLSFSVAGTAHSVTTSGAGAWALPEAHLPGNVIFEVSAPGYVTRRSHLQSVMTAGNATIDLIRDAPPFSLDFYRQLIRNQFDVPGSLLPLKRWTKNPAFYVNVRNPRTGGDLAVSEQDSIRGIIRSSVPHMTGSHFSAGAVEFGSGARAEKSGVVNVTLVDEPGNQFCGWSKVGSDPGAITLNLAGHCDTPCGAISPRTLAHEVGHALGFYHVARGDILSTNWSARECAATTLSWAEQHHARLAYSRPPGNRDTDFDPLATLFAQPAEVPVVIGCLLRNH